MSIISFGKIRFATYLSALAGEIRKARSGEKTRLKLMSAAARLLDDVGYRDLNVEEISAEAGLAKGTFYVHFETKDAFLRDLARQYVAYEGEFTPQIEPDESAFTASYKWVAWYEGTFARNVGVLRCIVQMGEADAEMRAIWHQRNEAIAARTTNSMERRSGVRLPAREHLFFVLRTVGGMLDQSLFNRFNVSAGTGHKQELDDDTLVRLHTVLLYRALYGCDPSEEEAGGVLAMLPRSLTP